MTTLPLTDLVIDALLERKAEQDEERERAKVAWTENGYILTTSLGTPIDPRNLERNWKSLLGKAGILPMPFHSLRHTCASFLLMQGVPLRHVQQVLRHSKLSLTADLYGHIALEVTRDAVNAMEGVIARNYLQN